MQLTNENYFSIEANKEFMSVSQYKNFMECEAKALNDLEIGGENAKEAFLEGKLFEAIVTGGGDLFIAKHPELISSTGKTTGQLKANFRVVMEAAKKFLSQKFFVDIINKCDKQVILTGEIEGVKTKCALDLFDNKTISIYDIKCMANFNEQWSKKEKKYIPWYYTYNYVLQLAIYKEIVRQNYGDVTEVGLIAASKESSPDVEALSFSNELLDLELENFKLNVKRFDDIKKHKISPKYCGECDYCKSLKEIKEFEVIK